MFKLSLLESFLIQLVFYSAIWLLDEYIGTLLCIIIPPIALGVLIISYISEGIEKSKVPNSYFRHMWLLIITPLIVGFSFTLVYGANFDWLQL